MTEPVPPDDRPSTEPDEQQHAPLRAAFVAVLAMAAFFVVTWLAVLAIAMERRG